MWPFRRNARKKQAMIEPLIAVDYHHFLEICEEVADELPFIGEEPFELRPKPRKLRASSSDHRFVRRVLVSWQIGRPVPEIAERAGCSTRLAQKVLRDLIYVTEMETPEIFHRWVEVGLVVPVDGPEYAGPEDDYLPWSQINPKLMPVICLVCHRLIGAVMAESRLHDGNMIKADQERFKEIDPGVRAGMPGCTEDMQAHLIGHFLLGGEPINVAKAK